MAQIKQNPNDTPQRSFESDDATNRRSQPEVPTHYPEAPEEHDEDEAGEGAPINNEDIIKHN